MTATQRIRAELPPQSGSSPAQAHARGSPVMSGRARARARRVPTTPRSKRARQVAAAATGRERAVLRARGALVSPANSPPARVSARRFYSVRMKMDSSVSDRSSIDIERNIGCTSQRRGHICHPGAGKDSRKLTATAPAAVAATVAATATVAAAAAAVAAAAAAVAAAAVAATAIATTITAACTRTHMARVAEAQRRERNGTVSSEISRHMKTECSGARRRDRIKVIVPVVP